MVLQVLYGSISLQPLLLVLRVPDTFDLENFRGAVTLFFKPFVVFQTGSLKGIGLVFGEKDGVACLSFYEWELLVITVLES